MTAKPSSGEGAEPAQGPPARVGHRFARRLVLSEEEIRAAAALLADHNPLHHDAQTARAEGYEGLSASGAHTGALLMALTATHFSQPAEDGTARSPLGLGFELRFSRPVFAGEEIELFWRIAALRWKASLRGWVTELEGGARSPRGAVLEATGRILLRLA